MITDRFIGQKLWDFSTNGTGVSLPWRGPLRPTLHRTGVLHAGVCGLAVALMMVSGPNSQTDAATLDGFNIEKQQQSVTIRLNTDSRVKYTTESAAGAFIVYLQGTDLSKKQVEQGLPIVTDPSNEVMGRAIPMDDGRVKIMFPNLSPAEYSISVVQTPGASASSTASSAPASSAPPTPQSTSKSASRPTSRPAPQPAAKPVPAPVASKPASRKSVAKTTSKSPTPRQRQVASSSNVTRTKPSTPTLIGAGRRGHVEPQTVEPKRSTLIENRYTTSSSAGESDPSSQVSRRPRPAVLSFKPQFEEVTAELTPKPRSLRSVVRRPSPQSVPYSSWSPEPSRPTKTALRRNGMSPVSPPVSTKFDPAEIPGYVGTGTLDTGSASGTGIVDPALAEVQAQNGFGTLALADDGPSIAEIAGEARATDLAVETPDTAEGTPTSGSQPIQESLPPWVMWTAALFLGGIGFFALIAAFYLVTGIFLNIRRPKNPADQPIKDSEQEEEPSVWARFNRYSGSPQQSRFAQPAYGTAPVPSHPTASHHPGYVVPPPQPQWNAGTPVVPSVGAPSGAAYPVSGPPGPMTYPGASIPYGYNAHYGEGGEAQMYLVRPSNDVSEAVRKGAQLKFRKASHRVVS